MSQINWFQKVLPTSLPLPPLPVPCPTPLSSLSVLYPPLPMVTVGGAVVDGYEEIGHSLCLYPPPCLSGIEDPSVGHTLTSTHSGPCPSPPSLLFLTQTLLFSDLPFDFSFDLFSFSSLRVSMTQIDPLIVKVLFFDPVPQEP